MQTENKIQYPVYRKYPHGKTLFKIVSESEFEELQILGQYYSIHKLIAKILPDRNYIYDLTFAYEGHWEVIDEAEYNAAMKECVANLIKL